MIDIEKIRNDFPILNEKIYDKKLVYFDNAATSQKPLIVIDAINNYYKHINSNVHRGTHYLSQKATIELEETREKIKSFINAKSVSEIIFTKGTTDSINLVAHSFGKKFINKDDEIIISSLEHHSNIVPWQIIAEEKQAKVKVIPINDKGELLLDEFKKLITSKTKIISVNHISNALGTINPIKEIIEIAKKNNIKILIDGAQASPHLKIDVIALDCDFYCFSAHKMCGPTGVGVLYGKEDILNELPPYQAGGEMIDEVTFEKTTYNVLPYKFEAGTPNIADIIAFKKAIEYLESLGMDNIKEYENELLKYGTEKLSSIEGLKIIGTSENKASVISFNLEGIHHFDAGTLLDRMGVAVRTGHHCTQPLMKRLNIAGTIRASFAFYNTKEEIDVLYNSIIRLKAMF